MFKTTSESLNHIDRVASASTRERANGRIDMIPPWAEAPEEYYNGLKVQFEVLQKEIAKSTKEIETIRFRLNQGTSRADLEKLVKRLEDSGQKQQVLQNRIREHREIMNAAAMHSWAVCFYHIAKGHLTDEQFRWIDSQTKEMLARPQREYKTKDQLHIENIKRAQTLRRKKFRERAMENKNRLVYSDEAGGVVVASGRF